jgi:hypothetical protein
MTLRSKDSGAAGNPWRRELRPESDREIAKEEIAEDEPGRASERDPGRDAVNKAAKYDRAYRPPLPRVAGRCRALIR